jgi:hypothetical protein
MAARKAPVHPATAAADARKAAKAAAAEKAQRAPHTLTAAELELLPVLEVLRLGNGGQLQHLGIGLPLRPAPKIRVSTSAAAGLTDDQLRKMSGAEVSRAMAAGRVPGVGARRKGRRH